MSAELDKAFSPAMLGKLPLKNRILKAATYEGKTPDGVPGDLLLDFHRSVVEGGTAAWPADGADLAPETLIWNGPEPPEDTDRVPPDFAVVVSPNRPLRPVSG